MRQRLLFLLLFGLLLCSCGVRKLLAPTPGQKLSELVLQHPELVRRDTIHDTFRVETPRLVVKTQVRVVRDTVREARDSHVIDSLLWCVSRDLSDAQHQAAKAEITRLLRGRPAFPGDTLRADTLGIHLRVWLSHNAYQIHLSRDPGFARLPIKRVREVLAPSGQPLWYRDRHIWLIIGLSLLCLLLLLAAIRR